MKTAIGAIQGMPTYELLEVADTVWAAQASVIEFETAPQ
jgi:hypothetical protein